MDDSQVFIILFITLDSRIIAMLDFQAGSIPHTISQVHLASFLMMCGFQINLLFTRILRYVLDTKVTLVVWTA